MNTKKYKAMFVTLRDSGEIPIDVYDLVMREIEKDGKMTKRVYGIYLTELEKRRLFDVCTVPFDTKNSAQTDGTYKYRSKNIFKRLAHRFWFRIFKIGAYVACALWFGVWRVKDKKKLKGIKACMTTSNHIGFLDSLFALRAIPGKQYIVSAPFNCKNDLGGKILSTAGELPLPLPNSLSGARAFEEMLGYAVSKNAKIHFYAEKVMWIGYKKPRPYKEGAFYYADKLDVPVVSMLYCFKKPRGLRKLLHLPKMEIRIADPLYVNKELPPRERRKDVCARAEQAVKQMYEEFYGIPLEYESLNPTDQTNETIISTEEN
ncbi:MAG: hypothetical protein HDT28_00835 [Clostridiales bacterium]|nr:hypothetical protein [Clostridiales bacterium]